MDACHKELMAYVWHPEKYNIWRHLDSEVSEL